MKIGKWHHHPSPEPKDRRFISDRRRFSYAGFIPERRSGKDRRASAPPLYGREPFPKPIVYENRDALNF